MSDARWDDPREYGDRNRDDERARVYNVRDRDGHDPRDGLMCDLDLPRGQHTPLRGLQCLFGKHEDEAGPQDFSSRFSCSMKRQSLPWAMSLSGLDLIAPTSCRRSA